MARLEPFPAMRYDPARVEPDDVVAPPYDVVGPAERARLAGRSPYNAIHVDLPVADPAAGLDPYENAARTFAGWHEEGVVRRDQAPGLYVYKMTYHDEHGRRRATTGLLGALGLDLDRRGDVLPHEQTMPKDRLDRLSLLRATRLNTSPIWGLSLAKGLTDACREPLEGIGGPAWSASGSAGVLHELWPLTGEEHLARIVELCAQAPVLLADGHHRFETARTYAAECRSANGGRPGPHDLTLAFVVELSEEELSIRAVHRLLHGVAPAELIEMLSAVFRIEPAPEDLFALPATALPGVIGLFTRDGYKLLYPLAQLAEQADDDLDTSRLEAALARLPEHQISYEPGWHEATSAVRDGQADAVFLLRPVPVAKVEAVAETGHLMPPKSTYFQPKPLTGMAFRSLD